jgi:hypothetical protein
MKQICIAICAAFLFTSCGNDKQQPTVETKVAAATTTVPAEPMPDSATMQKNWQAYMTPGKEHAMMASWNGKWEGEVTMWMSADAPPMVSNMTVENKMIMGGRYQQSVNKGSFGGMPFEGISTLAFDNAKKTWISTWFDNMGTGIITMEGSWDDATKTMTLRGREMDPSLNKEKDCRQTFTVVDDNHQLMQMYEVQPDGKERKTMQVHFTRKK